MQSGNNTVQANIILWLISIDIFMIICTIFVIILGIIFLITIVFDKTSRKISKILLCNSFISEIVFACIMFSMAMFTLKNDVKQIEYEDSYCKFRGYMSYAISAARSHSYLLQSIYCYMIVIHPTHLYFQSIRFQLFLISLTWIISIFHPYLFFHQIQYDMDNQVCHMPLQIYSFIFYTCFIAYLNPVIMINVIYFKLVRYIKGMSKIVTPVNQFLRAQRELKMIRRIVMLIIVLITLGLPYTIFFLMSFFTNPPKYHFRISFLFVDVSVACVMIVLFQFTDPIKRVLIKTIQ